MKLRVSQDNESFFNDQFWESQDVIVNALDNVQARLFVDSRCVYYAKPLLESGTLGTKANGQVVIPFQTQSYGDSVDPPEETFPLCTVKNFPYQIEHTIQYAREYFEGLFVEGPSECTRFVEHPEHFLKALRQEFGDKTGQFRGKLETLKKLS